MTGCYDAVLMAACHLFKEKQVSGRDVQGGKDEELPPIPVANRIM